MLFRIVGLIGYTYYLSCQYYLVCSHDVLQNINSYMCDSSQSE